MMRNADSDSEIAKQDLDNDENGFEPLIQKHRQLVICRVENDGEIK